MRTVNRRPIFSNLSVAKKERAENCNKSEGPEFFCEEQKF